MEADVGQRKKGLHCKMFKPTVVQGLLSRNEESN